MSPSEFWMLVHYRQTEGRPDGPGPVTMAEFEEMVKQDEERQRKNATCHQLTNSQS